MVGEEKSPGKADIRKRTRKVASKGHRRQEGTLKRPTNKNKNTKQKQKEQTKDKPHMIRVGQEKHHPQQQQATQGRCYGHTSSGIQPRQEDKDRDTTNATHSNQMNEMHRTRERG